MTAGGAPRRRYAPAVAATLGERAAAARRERRKRFKELLARAIDELPPNFRQAMSNVDVVIVARPSAADLRRAGLHPGDTLFGLYQGTPLTERGQSYQLVLPDKITLYRRTLEAACRTDAELVAEVRKTLLHELAHHFGIGDPRLSELGMD